MKRNNHSVINIPVQLDFNELEKTLNQKVQGLLYEDDGKSENSDGLAIKASKSDAIKLHFDRQRISYQVPLHLWIKKDLGFTGVEAEGDIELHFVTTYEIGSDWILNTQTELSEYIWKEKPVLKLGIIDVPINFIANRVVNQSKLMITQMIDEQVKNNFVLENYIGEAWKQLQQPILVSEEHELWVTFEAKNIGMTPLIKKDNWVGSTIVIKSIAEVKLGPEPKMELAELPPFQLIEIAEDDFKLNLFTEITYQAAQKMAKNYVIGQTFEQDGRSVKVEDLELYGEGDKMVVNTQLSGSYNGSIYIKGRPVYNEKKNEIEIEELEYKLKTDSFLHRSLAWLLKKKIKKTIVNALKFPLEEHLNESRKLIQEKLTNYEINPNLLLQGEMDRLDIGHTFLNAESIQMVISSQGRLHLQIKDLENIQQTAVSKNQ